MKIFQIGFNRCGTRSMHDFFKNQCMDGLKCLHWEGGKLALDMYGNMLGNRKILEGTYEDFDYYGDMQAFIRVEEKILLFLAHLEYKILDEQYPGSKFILNTRSVDGWIGSRMRHYGEDILRIVYGDSDPEEIWRKQWHLHHEGIVEYFGNRSDLLVFNIEKDEGQKIAHFLPGLNFNSLRFPKIK